MHTRDRYRLKEAKIVGESRVKAIRRERERERSLSAEDNLSREDSDPGGEWKVDCGSIRQPRGHVEDRETRHFIRRLPISPPPPPIQNISFPNASSPRWITNLSITSLSYLPSRGGITDRVPVRWRVFRRSLTLEDFPKNEPFLSSLSLSSFSTVAKKKLDEKGMDSRQRCVFQKFPTNRFQTREIPRSSILHGFNSRCAASTGEGRRGRSFLLPFSPLF